MAEEEEGIKRDEWEIFNFELRWKYGILRMSYDLAVGLCYK